MSRKPRSQVRATVDEITTDADDVPLASLLTDDGVSLVVPLTLLPTGTRDGDVLLIRFQHDAGERAARRAKVAELQARLFGERKGGSDAPKP
jgi:hypothetical protein